MTIKVSQLRLVTEVASYPALLARLAAAAAGLEPDPIPVENLLADVLEPDVSAIGSLSDRYRSLIEDGEIGAAQVLAEISPGLPSPDPVLTGTRVRLVQDIEAKLRVVMGLLLLLRESRELRVLELDASVEGLVRNRYLRDFRPGQLMRQLATVEEELNRLATETLERVRAEVTEIRTVASQTRDRDLVIAVNRLQELLVSQETLPLALRLLVLARRAREGQLNPEDLRLLHQEGGQHGRLLRPRADFAPTVRMAADALALVESQDSPVRFVSDFEADRTRQLLRLLCPREGNLNTERVATQLAAFLNLSVEPMPQHRGSLGSAYRVKITNPCIPALRDGERRFPRGVHLVIPLRADETTIPRLLQDVPREALRIVYWPVRPDRMFRLASADDTDVTYIDSVDILRLGECPFDQRAHAFQQVILPRLPLVRVKPYQGGGPVSQEMFRGRRDVIDRLKQPKGGTVLFSGRMMGKSSILTKLHTAIQQARTAGTREASVFVSSAGEDLFTPLLDKLASAVGGEAGERFRVSDRKFGIVPTLKPAERRERTRHRLANLRNLVAKLIDRDGHLTVLMDEADKFAAADAEKPREESLAWLLRDLEHEQPDKLRIVFAGFQTIHQQVLFKNGAFANWFGLVELGPLATDDAEALVTEPFADFGFLFASKAGVDRVLEFTGRHPLLIQETCARLMERMAARRRGAGDDEVIMIQAGDVETVCRDDQLRDRVRQVLSLNLEEYPRLKLMVYLILFAERSRSLQLGEFKLEELKSILVELYDKQFNDYFDERSISALVQELMALGLVSRGGDSYEFINRTFATMLREDRSFDNDLQRLLERVTDPGRAEVRRFFTLPNEDLERILRLDQGHALVVGLPRTLRSFIANSLFESGSGIRTETLLVSAKECRSQDDLRARLRSGLKESRTALTIGELLLKHKINKVVLDAADELAEGGALPDLIHDLSERKLQVVVFGGVALARAYARQLAAFDIDAVPLRRLRPQDIKAWGERGGSPGEDLVVICDEGTSRTLHKVTGGYFPLLLRFREHSRRRSGGPREFIPDARDLEGFAKDLTSAVVEEALLAPLASEERDLLRRLYQFASTEMAEIEWEFVDDMILTLATDTGEPRAVWLDRLEVLRLLDLVDDGPVEGRRRIRVDCEGPLRSVFGGAGRGK